jgi:AcrR family transcriptional regulator
LNESNRPSAALDGEQHVSGAARKRKRPPSPRQIAKNSETRRRLIEAAGLVVGKYGYAGASIARITAKAGVAHGTFYLHFANQQALFDVLLPELGRSMLDAISAAVRDSSSLEELERRGLTANIDYLVRNPALYRVMNEAALYAPKAYRQHVNQVRDRYFRSLQRSRDRGDLKNFSDGELETIVALLTGARTHLLLQFAETRKGLRKLDPERIETYLEVFLNGLRARYGA